MKHIRALLCLVMLLSVVACANESAPEEITYTVTLDFDYLGMIETQAVQAGQTAVLPSHEPTKQGYKNLGWFVEENGEMRAWDFATDVVNGDITIKLLREEDIQFYRYAYINGDGDGSVEVFEITAKSNFEEPRPYREGYTFLGWKSQKENYQTPEGYIVNNTYVAQWHDISEGLMVILGEYEQDGNTENGMEPIEWLVLDKNEDGSAYYLVSRYLLEWMPYHNTPTNNGAWASCDLRTWLNGAFVDKAFSTEERTAIQYTKRESTQTSDYVFLPCVTDENFMGYMDYAARIGIMTSYVAEKETEQRSGHHTTQGGSKGVGFWAMSNSKSSSVGGTVGDLRSRAKPSILGFHNPEGVRPAMWVDAAYVDGLLGK